MKTKTKKKRKTKARAVPANAGRRVKAREKLMRELNAVAPPAPPDSVPFWGYPFRRDGPESHHSQIAEALRLAVACGAIPRGARVPTMGSVAAVLGVNPNTVSKAYALLLGEGVLRRRAPRDELRVSLHGRELARDWAVREILDAEERARLLRELARLGHQETPL